MSDIDKKLYKRLTEAHHKLDGPISTQSETKSLNVNTKETIGELQPSGTSEAITKTIGDYQIVRQMGEGGMGTVYLAVRADQEYKQQVAIKVIRKGMDSKEIVARFRRERQILASLDHPNIAKLMDGGSTEDGLPYFVMEFIQGTPLTDYCEQRQLTTEQRLQLFRSVCSAVQFAHQNLIVHRDLKPANILVTSDGIPKLLDFGIAKLLDPKAYSAELPATESEVRVMTPEYGSPEQVKGDPITTATDIYSLGVILYELLAGRRPYRFTGRNQMELYRVICEQEPEKPSTAATRKQDSDVHRANVSRNTNPEKLRKELSGDLDNIILMALRKEPQNRYVSAEAFSEDVRRYLEGHPVQARKGTWSYKAGKYVKRHKMGVFAALTAFVLLIAFAVTVSIQNIRISEQRDAARKAQKKAADVTDFLAQLFQTNDPAQSKGEQLTARQILDKGAERLRTEFKDQPEVRSELMDRVGNIYVTLGLYDQAETILKESLTVREKLFGKKNIVVAETMGDLAVALTKKGDMDAAEKLLRESLPINRQLTGEQSRDVATNLKRLANVLSDEEQLAEAEKLYREALAIKRKYYGNEDPAVAEIVNNLALILANAGQFDEAEKFFRESLATARKVYGNDNPNVAVTVNNLAGILWETGKMNEAEKLLRESLAMNRKLLGNDHPNTGRNLNNLAVILCDKGELEEAEKLAEESLAITRKALGENHPYVAAILSTLSEVSLKKGEVQHAIDLANEALAFSLDKLPADSKYRGRAKSALGAALMMQGSFPESERSLLDAHKILSAQEKGRRLRITLGRIIDLYKAWGKEEEAAKFSNVLAKKN